MNTIFAQQKIIIQHANDKINIKIYHIEGF